MSNLSDFVGAGGSYEILSNTVYTNITTSNPPQFSFTQDKLHILELYDLRSGSSGISGIRPYLLYYDSSNVLASTKWIVHQSRWVSGTGSTAPSSYAANTSTQARFTEIDLELLAANRAAVVCLHIYQPTNRGFVTRGTGIHPKNGDPYNEIINHGQVGTIANISYIKVSPNAGDMSFRMRVLREI